MELLAPAGSYEALRAAVCAGADAVYFGGNTMNARMYSKNFSNEEIEKATLYCKSVGVKTYLTLNMLITDKEMRDAIKLLEWLNQTDIDGVIVQDIGLAHLMRQMVPSLPIHASTQMTICNTDGIYKAQEMGFSRVVVSRELPESELLHICKTSPIEIEAFIHGALCMCYSGQCLMSSVIGERSGNRGKCAQPCRKRYRNGFELSLKDLCVASTFERFVRTGVHSLKIEGRMKSPGYVAGVVGVYRRLIDEKRNATPDEIKYLEALFSREGFTNAYFEDSPTAKMFGVRTQENKEQTKAAEEVQDAFKDKKTALDIHFFAEKGKPIRLKMVAPNGQAEVCGDIPLVAQNAETTPEQCTKQLVKLGDTPFVARKVSVRLGGGLFLPVSTLNKLRRDGTEALYNAIDAEKKERVFCSPDGEMPEVAQQKKTVAYCCNTAQAVACEKEADEIWLPMFEIESLFSNKLCAVLPPILFDREMPAAEQKLSALKDMGIRRVVVKNIGQLALCQKMGFEIIGAAELNIFNSTALLKAREWGLSASLLSYELNSAQIRDMKKCMQTYVMVYGRYRMMTTENCILKNKGMCINAKGHGSLKDETGRVFPVFCAYPHRNEIYNAVPLYLGDRPADITASGHVFVFTTESPEEIQRVFEGYKKQLPCPIGDYTRGFVGKKV